MLIPGTGFNKNREKLFFLTGFEYYKQTLDTGLLRATVPTEGMVNGDFSPTEMAKLGTKTASGQPPGKVNQTHLPWRPDPGLHAGATLIDPNMQALMKLFPAAQRRPELHRRIQLRTIRNFQPEQPAVGTRVRL